MSDEMNIDRLKATHVEILQGIDRLRNLTHQGVGVYAADIASELRRLATIVTQHLAVEDRILYPQVEAVGDARMAAMSRHYQEDMKGIASTFIGFVRRWDSAAALCQEPGTFKDEANHVLKAVFDRMKREDREFYPAIEAL